MKKLLIYAVLFALPFGQFFMFNEKAAAQEEGSKSSIHCLTEGWSASLLTFVYTPVKLGVSLVGGVVGGVAYPLTGFNGDISRKIWEKSFCGTYVITEEILYGDEKFEPFLCCSCDDDDS